MIKLVCTAQHFHDPVLGRLVHRGEQITNQDEVARLMEEREREFVRVTMSAEEEAAEMARQRDSANPVPKPLVRE